MSQSNPIALLVFDHNDKAIMSMPTYTGYIPRKGEMIGITDKRYSVNGVVYFYENNKLDEVHLMTVERSF